MSRQYTEEQKSIAEKLAILRSELATIETRAYAVENFLDALKNHANSKTLTEYMLRELIERIEVSQSEKVDGFWNQRLRIVYHGIGSIELPSASRIPSVKVEMKTRKGVSDRYAPEMQVKAKAFLQAYQML